MSNFFIESIMSTFSTALQTLMSLIPLSDISCAYFSVNKVSWGCINLLPVRTSSAIHLLLVIRFKVSLSLIRIITGSPAVIFLSSSRPSLAPFLTLPLLVLTSRTSRKPSIFLRNAARPSITSTIWSSCCIVSMFTELPGVKIFVNASSSNSLPINSWVVSSTLSASINKSPANESRAVLILCSLSKVISAFTFSTSSSKTISPATNEVSPSSMTLTLFNGATLRKITSICLLFMLTPWEW